jgi:hypothetical protein
MGRAGTIRRPEGAGSRAAGGSKQGIAGMLAAAPARAAPSDRHCEAKAHGAAVMRRDQSAFR